MEHNRILVSKSYFEVNALLIGIDVNCCFVFQTGKSALNPINEENVVWLLRLLELNYSSFYKDIDLMVNVLQRTNTCLSITPENFPFQSIVKAALRSNRDYWIELSIPWLKEIGFLHFNKEIVEIQSNRNVNQKLRHFLLKLKYNT